MSGDTPEFVESPIPTFRFECPDGEIIFDPRGLIGCRAFGLRDGKFGAEVVLRDATMRISFTSNVAARQFGDAIAETIAQNIARAEAIGRRKVAAALSRRAPQHADAAG